MLTLLNRTVDYSLHSLLGFDILQTPLESFCIQEPSLALISELHVPAAPSLALSKKDKKSNLGNPCQTIEKIARDLETLLFEHQHAVKINALKVHAIDEDLKGIISKKQFSLLNNKHVFLESSDDSSHLKDIYDYVFDLQWKNYTPVLTFPEKNSYFTSKNQRLLRLKDRGCVFQVDLLSLSGYFGLEAKKVASTLLETKQVHFVSFLFKNLEVIKKNKGIKITRKTADLLNEQLFKV